MLLPSSGLTVEQHPRGRSQNNSEDGDEHRDVKANDDINDGTDEAKDGNVEAKDEAAANADDGRDKGTDNLAVNEICKHSVHRLVTMTDPRPQKSGMRTLMEAATPTFKQTRMAPKITCYTAVSAPKQRPILRARTRMRSATT